MSFSVCLFVFSLFDLLLGGGLNPALVVSVFRVDADVVLCTLFVSQVGFISVALADVYFISTTTAADGDLVALVYRADLSCVGVGCLAAHGVGVGVCHFVWFGLF